MPNNERFSAQLIVWYENSRRELPWRNIRDPYKIWLSEVILQQTRVAQGLPYYLAFIEKFETVYKLAAASEQEVLRLWQGLGYYSRARNLHKCAKEVVEKYDGHFPSNYKELLQLPGIGKYTAAAIASFCYKEKVPVIDGNVYRVLARIFGISSDIATGKGQKPFEELAATLISDRQPDIYNQAIMEFGALHCTPKSPACVECIFHAECHARIHNTQNQLPVKSKTIKVKSRCFHYIVIKYKQKTAMKVRKDKDIWQGLYDYPLIETTHFHDIDSLGDHDIFLKIKPFIATVDESIAYKHVLTHQRIHARFFTIVLKSEAADITTVMESSYGLKFYTDSEIQDLPKPVLVSRYLNDPIF